MTHLRQLLNREPAMIIGAIVGVVALFGVEISTDDSATYASLLALVLPLVSAVATRQLVTPALGPEATEAVEVTAELATVEPSYTRAELLDLARTLTTIRDTRGHLMPHDDDDEDEVAEHGENPELIDEDDER